MKQTITFTPWRSIREGAIGVPERTRSFEEALDAPCATCRSAPCCTHLPVHNFRINTLADLSFADYLLNFDHLRLGVNRSGDWSVYYVYPCRFLDRTTFGCTVHNTPEQPQICVSYNPYTCWYKRSLTSMVGEEFVLVDRARLDHLKRRTRFDELRNVVEMPTWAEIGEVFADLSDTDAAAWTEDVLPDPGYDAWRALVLGQSSPAGDHAASTDSTDPAQGQQVDPAPPQDLHAHAYAELRNPCDGCSAPCCETLTFAQGRPLTISSLDFFRFCLGFPGVELYVTDDVWWLAIKSRCRHLENGRCRLYGRPERPLQCKYYDAWKCTYRTEFGQARPPGGVRIRLDHYEALTDCVAFDADGAVTAIAPVEAIRAHVETRWRETASTSA